MTDACDSCLRRAFLVARLAPRIAALLDRPRRRPGGLLALDDDGLIAAVGGRGREDARAWLEAFDPARARAELGRRAWAVCAHARLYPARLAQLSDPPAVLFGCGRAETLERLSRDPAVTIVGTRRGSPYGLEVARNLGRGLGAAGLPVVSGLALGIDAAAHLGCLDTAGAALAVLAGAPDDPYPPRNRNLYRRVLESGAVISELPPGRRAYRWSFPARNRIMAGLAAMTVVVEAAEPSGSLITAEFARDLGRAVGAVSGRITSSMAAGSNRLLQDGAAVVIRAEDVLDELYGAGRRPVPVPAARPEPPEGALRSVLRAVEACHDAPSIAAHAGLDAAGTRAALGRLEAEGFVGRDALGGYHRRSG